MNLSLMLFFLFLTTGANETGVGFQAQQNQTHRRLVSQNKLLQLPCYSPNLSIHLNQEVVDIPKIEPRTGCFLVNWGVPRWAVQGSVAFVGGHIGGWLLSGASGSILLELPSFYLNVLSWFPQSFDSYGFQKFYLASWCFVGLPLGSIMTTMGSGAMINPGGSWGETFRGSLMGDVASLVLTVGYYIVFGDPWAYGTEGGHPIQGSIGPFVNIFLPIVSTLPAVGAVIGYTKSISELGAIERESMGCRGVGLERTDESFANPQRDGNPSLRIPLVKVVF